MFLVNSRHPYFCAPYLLDKAPFSRTYGSILPSSFNAVLSSALVCSTSPPVSVWGTVYTRRLFPGTLIKPPQSNKGRQLSDPSHILRYRNINLFPIDYAFLPRLRGRLTLLRLALSRKPWAYGESVSHTLYRYSCQHSHFCSLHRIPHGPASSKNSLICMLLITISSASGGNQKTVMTRIQIR